MTKINRKLRPLGITATDDKEKPNQMNQIIEPQQIETPGDEISLIDLLLVLLERKKMIFCFVLAAGVLSVTFSLLMPDTYTATTTLLPPQELHQGLILPSAGSALGDLGADLFKGNSAAELYVGVLQSRSVADRLIEYFNLKDLYELEYLESTYEKLADRTNINISTETTILSLSVEDEDPQRAADMANLYMDSLDLINRTVNITESQRKRIFLENRLVEIKKDLIRAELNLKTYQEKHKLMVIDAQARAAIEGAAKLKGEIIAAQTELEVLKQFGTERQNEAVLLKATIAELKNQLAKIELGNPAEEKDSVYISFKNFPSLAMEQGRLIRESKIQEEVFKLLTSQHEMAEIEEAKDINTIQILDRQFLPTKNPGQKEP